VNRWALLLAAALWAALGVVALALVTVCQVVGR